MNRQLIIDNPLVLDRTLARLIGLNEAIIFQQIAYWIRKNEEKNRNYYESRYWTYNTYEEWTKEFPFWSKDTIKRTFKKLREIGLIITGRFNLYQMDRTLWYAIDYEKLEELKNTALMEEGNFNPSIGADSTEDESQNEQMDESNMTPAIPEITSETSTEISIQSISLSDNDCDLNIRDESHDFDRQIDRAIPISEEIIEKCSLYAVEEDYRDATEETIRILVVNSQRGDRVKIGDNFIPPQIIAKNLCKLDFFVVSHAIDKFKKSSMDGPIRNPVPYLKACIYNAIFEMRIDLDGRLRYGGLVG